MLRNEQGFTVPELIAVILVLIAILAGSSFLLRPKSYDVQNRDSERRIAIAQILETLQQYRADKGAFPEGVDKTAVEIGSGKGELDLCKTLVPNYLPDIPLDPAAGHRATDNGGTCDSSYYQSGYALQTDSSGQHLTVLAPAAENEDILLTR